ncbi:MAG TPA: riboflavin synthase [Gemmatimonadales bacterium]
MFTGIVTAIGTIRQSAAGPDGLQLTIQCAFPDLELGESIAVDGACLTVQSLMPGGFSAHVVRTTQERTRIGEYAPGQRVNLERALRVGERLGGHLVQGHVDAVGRVERVEERAAGRVLDLHVPKEVDQVSVPLGSITVDGVSLTVNAKPQPGVVQISLVPFTLQHTTLGERRVGDRVHVEADTIGKYLWSFMQKAP